MDAIDAKLVDMKTEMELMKVQMEEMKVHVAPEDPGHVPSFYALGSPTMVSAAQTFFNHLL